MITTAILAVCLACIYYAYVKYSKRKWPPGPFPFPIIGGLVEVALSDARPHVGFQKLAKKYGSVFSVKMGIVDYVVINGYAALKTAMTSGQVDDRFHEDWCLDQCFGSDQYGLLFSAGQYWKDTRKYTVRALKEAGFHKTASVEQILLEELRVLVQRIKIRAKENEGLLKNSELAFNAAFVNIAFSQVTGVRFKQDDPKFVELIELLDAFFSSQDIGNGVLGAYPFLKDWAPEMSGFGPTHRANEKLLTYFENVVESFRKKGDYKHNPTNFIEKFLQLIDNGPSHEDYATPIFNDKNLIALVNDLFAGSSETAAKVVTFAVRHMIQEPQLQARMRNEIDRVVGKQRPVQVADRQNLKYTEAFILETLRTETVGPIGPRCTTDDFKIGPYVIPKGTNVMANYYSANMDETVWEKPEQFWPERFLDEHGNIINAEKIATFAFGKRECPAQVLAKNTLTTSLATLVQNFEFKPDPVAGIPKSEVTKGITVNPVPFKTLVEVRSLDGQ